MVDGVADTHTALWHFNDDRLHAVNNPAHVFTEAALTNR